MLYIIALFIRGIHSRNQCYMMMMMMMINEQAANILFKKTKLITRHFQI